MCNARPSSLSNKESCEVAVGAHRSGVRLGLPKCTDLKELTIPRSRQTQNAEHVPSSTGPHWLFWGPFFSEKVLHQPLASLRIWRLLLTRNDGLHQRNSHVGGLNGGWVKHC